MAYFAQIDDAGIVTRVIRVDDNDAPDEIAGRSFIASLGLSGSWVQTSYSGATRKQYAGIGYRYDAGGDVFIAPQPFPSWTLDGNHDWQAPTPMPPEVDHPWTWDEDTMAWEALTPIGLPESQVDDWIIGELSA